MKKSKQAFTLTEILVALGIIGIIVVLIVPAFINSYGKRVMGAQLNKVCSRITTAARHIISDEHSSDLSSIDSDYNATSYEYEREKEDGTKETIEVSYGFYNTTAGVKTSNAEKGAQFFLTNYFKHSIAGCGAGNCLGESYTTSNGTNVGTVPASFYCIKTPNDAAICMRFKEGLNRTQVLVDVNGTERPNVTGSDVFVMSITNDGNLVDLDSNANNCNRLSNGNDENIIKYSAGCFSKILELSWNMRDYEN